MSIARPEWLPNEQFPFRLRQITLAKNRVTYLDEGDGAGRFHAAVVSANLAAHWWPKHPA